MSRTLTRSEIRSQARALADQEASGANAFVDDSEADSMLNGLLGVWHGLIAKAEPERYEAQESINAANDLTNGEHSLPADHYQTLGVDRKESDDDYVALKRASFHDRTHYSETTSGDALAYRLKGSKLVFLPAPDSGTYRHIYVTHAPTLTSDSDTVEGVNGWEQWLVYALAIKMLQKEGSLEEAQSLALDRDRLQAEIEAAAVDRVAGDPRSVADTRRRTSQLPIGRPKDNDFWVSR